MDLSLIFGGIVIFLFILAVFDLMVGVSNDAVNFLNSAVGAKVATYRTIIIVAAIGVFVGATMSNGMMDIARHGIFQPEHFAFYELMCIFLAVMVADVIILDVFNSLGMPTSTTVSLVFELLGATFMIATIKIIGDSTNFFDYGNLLNTEKALSVILAIFLSVAIAFIAGTIVMFVSRLVFSFNYEKNLKWTIGLFGGVALTAIAHFTLMKGLGKSSLMTPEISDWIQSNSFLIIAGMFVGFTLLMQLLHILKINVFKIIVLVGTFSLALAFAGNDLVNFIGVPLAGYSAYTDFVANNHGADVYSYMMGELNKPASTPIFFLIASGAVMVYSLATSKKAKNVIKTSVDLSRQREGDEMFGSSSMARLLVRNTLPITDAISKYVPESTRKWIDSRFRKDQVILEQGAAFDLVRAAVNLVLAGLLITMGTNLKLPLSTTYVTFIVAMGSSLADRAWGRESAVYRITGVLSVIGGWFITAFIAFLVGAVLALGLYYGGVIAMYSLIFIVVIVLVKSNKAFKKKQSETKRDEIFDKMVATNDKAEAFRYLRQHVAQSQLQLLDATRQEYDEIIDGIIGNNLPLLRKAQKHIKNHKNTLRTIRQRELVGMRVLDDATAIEYNTWFHLGINGAQQTMYSLVRMVEPLKEHVDNNFSPMPDAYCEELHPIRSQIDAYIRRAYAIINENKFDEAETLLEEADRFNEELSGMRKMQLDRIQNPNSNMKILLIYLNIIQESQELLSGLRHMIRATKKFITQ